MAAYLECLQISERCYIRPRRLIPDPIWAQCFALFAAIKASAQPAIIADLMAYMTEIAKYAKRFQWPCWVIYDQMASHLRPGLLWTRAEPAVFAQCFLGLAKNSAEAWCRYCHSVDHTSDVCGEAPRKAPRIQVYSSGATQICRSFNSTKRCFFQMCKYLDRCAICKGPTPKFSAAARGRAEKIRSRLPSDSASWWWETRRCNCNYIYIL